MHPNWLGSPQHVAGGAGLAFAAVLVGRRFVASGWLLAVLAVGVTATAEILIELVEYPLLYADAHHSTAYFDTLADMASTLAGAIAGVAAGLLVRERR